MAFEARNVCARERRSIRPIRIAIKILVVVGILGGRGGMGGHAASEAGIPGLTATHDAQDRLVTHGRFALTHSDSGHLASKTDTLTGERASYRYDEFGNLLGAELADGRSIQYLIDGADRRVAKLIDGELQWLFAYASGLPVARLYPDGAVESLYVYGALAHVPDVILKAGRTYRIIHDHLGSPRLVVDVETGAIAQRLDYDVHGRVLVDTAPDFQPFAFAGGLHDIDTGLVRFGARDYDPELARWTAKDPSGFAGNDTNLYAYAYGDPVNFVDPDGELAFLIPLAVLALKGALIGAATDAGIELASQLIDNGGNIDCRDWGDVVGSGVNGATSGGLTGPLGRALSTANKFRKAAEKFHKHHTVPREILKKLPPDVAKAVRGQAGAPNRWSIPEDLHKAIHEGRGGGAYNDAFKQRLRDLGRDPAPDDVVRIRDDLVKQFGLEGFRP
jgi:RHS repeat-associated protein